MESDALEDFRRAAPGFELGDELGRGGMGVVFRAVDLRLHRPVAIKFLRSVGPTEAERARFAREVRLYGRLSHPHLVRVFDADPAAELPYLVLELIEGRDLGKARRAGERVDALALGRALSSALAYIHGEGVLHRDLKPANVLLSAGRPLLTDFGLAREVSPDATALTADGQVVGTFAYMAPEVIGGAPHTAASDVYALALLLYEAAGGRLPGFHGPRLNMEERLSGRVPRLADSGVQVAPALDDLLSRALELEPQRRPDAARLSGELEAVGRHSPSRRIPRRSGSARSAPVPVPRRAPRPAALAAIAALVAAVLAIAPVTNLLKKTSSESPSPAIAPVPVHPEFATLIPRSRAAVDVVWAHQRARWDQSYGDRSEAIFEQDKGVVERLRVRGRERDADVAAIRALVADWERVPGAAWPLDALAARCHARAMLFLAETEAERGHFDLQLSQTRTYGDRTVLPVGGLEQLSQMAYGSQAAADFESYLGDLRELFERCAALPTTPTELVDALEPHWHVCQSFRSTFAAPSWALPFCRSYERFRTRVAALPPPLARPLGRIVDDCWLMAWGGCDDRKAPTVAMLRADIAALAAAAPATAERARDLGNELASRLGKR